MTNSLLRFPENFPGPVARKDPAPTILETVKNIETANKRRSEQGSVRKDFQIVLALLTGAVVFAGCAPAVVEVIATAQPDNTPGGSDALPTNPSIVPLDNPDNIEKLFTPTPDAVTVQPTAISPVEIGNYIDDQPRILDEYVVVPPADLLPSIDGDSIGQESADNLKRMAFVPVSVVGGVDYIPTEDRGVGLIPLPNMSTETGDVLTLDAEASKESEWFVYKGVDANNEEVIRYSPKYVECKGECATAIWFGKGDKAGTTLIFDMDPDTGEVKGVAQAFYTEMNDKVVFGEFDRAEWSTEISGADAIVFAIDNGAEMAYDPESETVSFTTENGENNQVIWVDLNDYHYVDEFGAYVDVIMEDGSIDRYVEIDGNFVKSERIDSLSNAPVYVLGQKSFIEKDGLVEWVDKFSVDEKNGDIIVVNDNKEWKWDGNDWVQLVVKLSLERIEGMTSSEMLDAAPAIDGYNPLRVAERYVLYESTDGVRDLAYDMSTGEEVEIPQYKICSNEKFYECVITQEDLLNGKYWLWLNTLDVKFDPSKIKDVPFVIDTGEYGSSWVDRTTVYHDSGPDSAADFADPSTAPFVRDVTAGVVLFNDNGVETFDSVKPVFFYDKKTDTTYPVIAVESYYNNVPGQERGPRSGGHAKNDRNWRDNYNVTPLAVGCYTYEGERMCKFSLVSGATDPILEASEKLYPDMESRILEFASGNYVALSKPGLIVQTTSDVYPKDNRYK